MMTRSRGFYDSAFAASQPVPAGTPTITTGGLWLPYASEDIVDTVSAASVVGTANTQEETQFISPVNIQLGHVTIRTGTGLAGALMGIAVYSGDGLTKLAAADGFSVAASNTTIRTALNVTLNLLASTLYWLAWTLTDATTQQIVNILTNSFYGAIKNQGTPRIGTSGTATAGGVTNSNIGVVTGVAQNRIPTMFFD